MSYNPEKALWQEVLLRVVDDALNGPIGVTGPENKMGEIRAARRYLTQPTQSLDTVCALAGMDLSFVMDRMRKLIADAPSPEELATKNKTNRTAMTKRPRSIADLGQLNATRRKPTRPGVGSNFRGSKGTGGGTSAQDTPKITFSEREAS